MRNFLKAFLFFLCWATIALFIHNHALNDDVKNIVNEVNKEQITLTSKKTTPLKKEKDTLQLTIKKEIIPSKKQTTKLNFNDKFITSANNTRVLFPKKFYYFKDSIFNFLNNNSQKEITIKATYLKNELLNNNSNFGYERALYLKRKLIQYGVNPKRINIESKIDQYEYDPEGFYADGITITCNAMANNKIASIENEITNKTLHSSFGNNSFKPDRTLYSYTKEVKNYLRKHPNKKITIIGHTDNLGEEEANNWIGLERAKNVSNYFIKQGINKTIINSTSKGEATPIADNSTKEGRAKNRRIEILIN
ncbi:OmpA family protein [uncultured Tenacibaculum sp.]|uniref:OmpA family protein n=1 Tax=uncultured Tenacibaculum sp. TaxID=174713 RepID=UPI0026161021|nr:OmpA family protein [uncultured Tenacibaculum sp.]